MCWGGILGVRVVYPCVGAAHWVLGLCTVCWGGILGVRVVYHVLG